MGLRGEAAILGFVELAPQRKPTRTPRFAIEQWALLAAATIADSGVPAARVNGLVTSGLAETALFAPATLAEYLGLAVNFGEYVDLGGATAAGMVWRAAAAVELGVCDAVLAVLPGSRNYPVSARRPPREVDYFGASSNNFGSPQAEFEIPYGNLGQNA